LKLGKFSELKNTQLTIIFWGFIFGFSGGGTTFPLVFNVPIYPFGTWGIVFYVLASGYAITKHELLNIKVVITRSGAFLLTLMIFATGYVALLLPYRHFISTQIDIPFVVMSVIYGGLGVGLYFHRIQQFFQTSAYRKFLNFRYNFEETLKTASSQLVSVQETGDVLDAIFAIQSSLEIGDSYAILKEEDGYNWYVLNRIRAEYEQNEEIAKQKMGVEPWMPEILRAFDTSKDSVSTLGSLPKSVQITLQEKLGLDEKLPYLAIHSFKEVQAVFILGQKLSEEEYTTEELSLFEIMLNQAITVFERIMQTKKILDLNKELELNLTETTRLKNKAIEVAKQLSHQAMMSTLMAGVSHEVRNPITSMVIGMACLAERLGGREKEVDEEAWTEESDENIEWEYPIDVQLFRMMLGEEATQRLMAEWVQNGYLTPEYLVSSKFKAEIVDIKPLELSEKWRDRATDIKHVFKNQLKIHAVYRFVNMAQQQFNRILGIVDNMMKYGVSGGGVKKDIFTKISGVSPDISEDIFNELVEKGYLDSWGGILERFSTRDRSQRLDLSTRLQPYHDEIIRVIEGSPGVIKTRTDIIEVLNSTLGVLSGNLHKKGIEIKTDYEDNAKPIMGDKLRFQQVFFNIIFNAIQAFEGLEKDPKTITISVKFGSFRGQTAEIIDGVEIILSDNGPGIPEETLEKIFYPFFSTKAPTGGKNAGLGLSIVRDIIMNHGGFVGVESEVGKGTSFIIALPTVT
jgi:signal transduction histidine kinase